MQLKESSHLFKTFNNPKADELGRSAVEFLHNLEQAAHIYIKGRDSSRSRVMVTLLHGNEPSGLTALFRLIQKQIVPAVDIHCFIPNVEAALKTPLFSNRALPGIRDMNRCFYPPYSDKPGKIAGELLNQIKIIQPECVIDIHNTSGTGPAFGVTTYMDEKHDALVSLFTQRIIVTDLQLGALMEISEASCPTVTIECGGAQDEESMDMAEEGLQKYFTFENVLIPPAVDFGLDFYHNPIRLELKDKSDAQLTYADEPSNDGSLTLFPDIEHHNFNTVKPGVSLGFISQERMEDLTAKTVQGEERLFDFFESVDGQLRTKKYLKFFMITTNARIAKTDCILYLVSLDDEE